MTSSVQALLDTFDGLSERERHEAAVELLRRVLRDAPSAIPEESFVAVADELFLELDAREAADGHA